MFCLVGLSSCESTDEKRIKLYRKIFKETEPHLDRNELIRMLKDLRELYFEDDYDGDDDVARIDSLLEDSKVSENKCNGYFFKHACSRYSGRANELVDDSRRLQTELCKRIWEESMVSSIDSISEYDKEIVGSIIKSMISANGGENFEGHSLEMPYKAAQEGVLNFMELKTGSTFSSRTKQDKFNKAINDWILDPCDRVVSKLLPVSNRYLDLASEVDPVSYNLNPKLLLWAKHGLICQFLRGSGYVSSERNSFREDIFENLSLRKRRGFWGHNKIKF